MIPTMEAFQAELDRELQEATAKKLKSVLLISRVLHRKVGGYPGSNHRMPMCCDVMYRSMHDGDEIVAAPPKGKGATLMIRYYLSNS